MSDSDGMNDGWPEEDPAIGGDPLGLSALLDDEAANAEDQVVADVPTEDSAEDLAELAEVEADLDTRWPETKIEPSLTRISTLMDLLGSPQHGYPAIHIAGTNGKTSVTRMIDALLVALHRRTGRITSPHLQRVTERISLDGKPIAARTYIDTYRELEPYITMVDDSSTAAGGPRMSKFEVLTAMAYAVFAEAPVDVAVVETGMGGRWDATNVIDAAVAVITPIPGIVMRMRQAWLCRASATSWRPSSAARMRMSRQAASIGRTMEAIWC